MAFATMPSVIAHVRSGKLRPIAVTSLKRSSAVPEVPTVAENGLPGYEMVAWQGLVAPKATPTPIIRLINREIASIVQQPDVTKQLAAEGGAAVANSPEEFARWLKVEIAKWSKVAKEANIRAE
jgi:tripartite-type tricarboxylate transporter receptor subunit TctC